MILMKLGEIAKDCSDLGAGLGGAQTGGAGHKLGGGGGVVRPLWCRR